MKAITPMTNLQKDSILDALLTKRKAPLSDEALRQTLQDLTAYIARNGTFYAAVFPKEEARNKSKFAAADIEKADIMQADDNQLYFPVFSDYEKLKKFRPERKENEVFCLVTKEDLLSWCKALEYMAENGAICVVAHDEALKAAEKENLVITE